ncbi:SDR family oxidoreductase [Burkholderia sp. Ax-1719]|uniref:SDR family NAD(P)-dependent oxidoreductase n=1 Tax=Burkholderia sp. Ax-1719 TaxID=2608334 RepID=UPI001420B98C|nr:SDR family oxidoreductase [Burkholderia sp. Ax-1719]NIE62260.1 SDR family oxidoreductase [Burkholderia sp. Ax-1719]
MTSPYSPEQGCVVITGAGTGIGEACARLFAAQGARVALIGRRRAPLERVAAMTGGIVLEGDAASAADWERFSAALAAEGGVTSLIACAGGLGAGSALETSDDDWAGAMRANLDTAFVSARACLPQLIARRGSIVMVASIASLAAGPEVCGYTTAKHALIGLMRSLARDYGPRGVRVNAVCPGWVKTPMADEEMVPLVERYGDTLEQAYARVCADVPMRRAAGADEIARVCGFLASDAASIVTGAVIVADGGASVVDVPTLAFERV